MVTETRVNGTSDVVVSYVPIHGCVNGTPSFALKFTNLISVYALLTDLYLTNCFVLQYRHLLLTTLGIILTVIHVIDHFNIYMTSEYSNGIYILIDDSFRVLWQSCRRITEDD